MGNTFMGVFDNYNCVGQMSLFDFIEDENKAFCWDEDINELKRRLHGVADKYGIAVSTEEWEVWKHVPKLGYRMSFHLAVTKENLRDVEFQTDIDNIVEYGKSRKVEVSPMWGACLFYGDKKTANLFITTLFMDKERRRKR